MPIIYRLVSEKTQEGVYTARYTLACEIQHTNNCFELSSITPPPAHDPLLIKSLGLNTGDLRSKIYKYCFGFESLEHYFAWFSNLTRYKRRVRRHLQLQQLYVPLNNIVYGTKQCIFLKDTERLLNNLSPITGKPL